MNDLRSYLSVVWRRRWIVILLALTIPPTAYIVTARQAESHEATADVLLSRQSQSISGVADPNLLSPERLMATQARVAREPAIALRVLQKEGLTRPVKRFLRASFVHTDELTDVLTFGARDENPRLAVRLANRYARVYIASRQGLETRPLAEATRSLDAEIAALIARGQIDSALYVSLVEKRQQLSTAIALLKSNSLLIREAVEAGQVAPRPMRMAAIGLVLALVIGFGLVFLLDALDTGVRSAEEAAAATGLNIIGQIPRPYLGILKLPRRPFGRFRARRRLVMLDEPDGADAEPFRMLRTNLEFVRVTQSCDAIMVTSALRAEGKSTTAANLAVALARAGRQVLLLDLDLRRPSLHKHFELDGRPGISDVVLGRASLDDAITRFTFASFGVLEVIGAGSTPFDPGEFVMLTRLADALKEMQDRADLVLVDGPPLLVAGDTLTLSAKLDGLLVVARVNRLRRGDTAELRRMLASTPAAKLGLVVTGTSPDREYESYGDYRTGRQSRQPVA